MVPSTIRDANPYIVGDAIGFSAGVLGVCAIRWLRRSSEESSEKNISLIHLNGTGPKTTRVTLSELRRIVSFQELNQLRASVDWGERTDTEWMDVFQKSTHVVCVTAKDPKLVGFGCFLGNGKMGAIFDVIVHRNCQKQGVGTLVMNELVDNIPRNYDCVDLSLWSKNQEAAAFYARFGFKRNNLGMEASGGELTSCRRSSREKSLSA